MEEQQHNPTGSNHGPSASFRRELGGVALQPSPRTTCSTHDDLRSGVEETCDDTEPPDEPAASQAVAQFRTLRVPGRLVLVLAVHRHDRHLHPRLSGVQENRKRCITKET
jgi:hypothetical protein